MGFTRLYENMDFESGMKDISKNNNFTNIFKKNSFEYHYFLSSLRHNLFSWYPFKKEGSLLEIGSSYGQLTSLFTQKVNQVVAIEDTESKAEIISNRAKKAKVIVSEFDKITVDEKFDYIVLCNIFEYVKSFYESENPYVDYLNYLKTFLKNDGVILIALSNRLGLKYFSGFREEHTNQFFTGINGYPNCSHVETFTKSRLIKIIQSANFDNYKFFYPYPDHEFPQIINTDAFVNKIPYNIKPIYFNERSYLFREDILNQILAKEGMTDYFSNSFLIEIRNSDEEFETDEIDFVKINTLRKPKFQTNTIIKSNNMVYKYPISQNAKDHVKKIYDNCESKFGKIKYLNCDYNDDYISYNFLEEKSLENMIIESILDDNKNKFFKLLEGYYDALFYKSYETDSYSSKNFISLFKEKSTVKFHCHVKSNLDLNFSNIFIINNDYVAIDYEWIFNFPIPIEYIFYRTIKHYIESNQLFNDFTSITEIFRHFNLNMSNIQLFETWEKNFLKYVFNDIKINKHKIIPKENLDYVEKIDEYVDLLLDSKNMDSLTFESLKRDIVLNQRRIIKQKNIELNKKDLQIKKKNKQLKKKNKEYKKLLNSTSWKITKPLRKLKKIFK